MTDFTVLLDRKVKIKENETSDKFLDLAKEQQSYGIWEYRWYQL